ncbi:ABC transporter substrate-binding protein [Ruminococcaceae bacterium OttesenSCG-928-A11]|nr:ABC transporter substrate-binding protein [Ruminococcaceae bacterium OttesenSCG-928-A11]
MKKFFAIALALTMLLALAACGDSSSSTPAASTPAASTPADDGGASADDTGNAATGDPVKVGFLGFMSGPDNYLGVQPELAIKDYLEEVNANGGWLGRPVELVTYDVARSIDEFVPATTKMIEQDGCVAIVGPTNSAGALAAMPVVTENEIPLVAMSATSEKVTINETTGELNPYMFRVCFIDPYLAEGLSNFALDSLGLKKIAVLGDVTNAYSVGLTDIFVEAFEGRGGEVVAQEGFNENDIEFRAQLANIGATDAEAIFLPANNIRYGVLAAQQARELGIEIPFIMPDSVYGPELLEAAEELEGSYVGTGLIDDDPAYDDYRAQFTAKHNLNANIFVYYGLDAIMAVEAAVKQANSLEPNDIRNALETLTDAPVFTGSLTVDPATHNPLNKPVTIMEIKDGEFALKEVFDPSK